MNLFQASENGTLDECQILLEFGADVNATSNDWPRPTPLILAAKRGRYEICKLLLNYGADCNIKDLIGALAIEYASFNGHEEIVELLKGTLDCELLKCNNNELHEAARKGDANYCLTATECLNVKNAAGDYPIHIAAKMGHTNCVAALINAGSDVNQICETAMAESSLHFAAEYGNLETCRTLLEAGASVDLTDGDYHTPLLYAANARRLSVCRLLLKYGACPSGHPEGGNPLEYAKNNGFKEIVEEFERKS